MTLTEGQAARVREIAELYHPALQAFRKNLPQKARADIRTTWDSYSSLMDLDYVEGDLAALGALLPFAALLETLPAEEVRQAMMLAILSHLDRLLD